VSSRDQGDRLRWTSRAKAAAVAHFAGNEETEIKKPHPRQRPQVEAATPAAASPASLLAEPLRGMAK
jgi:hypothetical protein